MEYINHDKKTIEAKLDIIVKILYLRYRNIDIIDINIFEKIINQERYGLMELELADLQKLEEIESEVCKRSCKKLISPA
jgi:hypothetical protein